MGVQVLSYELIKNLSVNEKVDKILEIVKKGEIVMLEGRLRPDEEMLLTSKALKGVSSKFSGVEIAFLDSKSSSSFIESLREKLLRLIAKERVGITVVGPSKIIKEIKMDPNKLEILM